jgi:small basic protein (TIGR04137 family)
MSIDSSLRLKDALVRHRNVLTRAERISKLKDEERWEEDSSVLGLPKVAHRKSHAGKKEAKEKEAAEALAGAEGAPAGAAKAAAPAAGKPAKEAKKK